MNQTLLIFAKSPLPGLVKTRLSSSLAEDQIVTLYKNLLISTLENTIRVDVWDTELWLSPDTEHPFCVELSQRFQLPRKRQQGVVLGEILEHAIQQHNLNDTKLVLIGSDCPVLTEEHIHQAFELLDKHDCVISPAEDGGFVLLGLKVFPPALFENIIWSSTSVCKTLMTNAKLLNLSYFCLETLWDVDTPKDLQRLKALPFNTGLEPCESPDVSTLNQ